MANARHRDEWQQRAATQGDPTPNRNARPPTRALDGRYPSTVHANPVIDRQHQVVPMKVGVARESAPGERRVALVPEALGKLTAAGLEILVEQGAGSGAAIPDSAY
ncbi:MAG: hypothetical protein ABIZ72_03725, partial [Candidatus Limnocylindrales bacterium]